MVYRFEDFEVDETNFRLTHAGTPVPLEPKILHLLLYLVRNRNRLIRKQELLDSVWQEAFVTENALTRSVGLLRKALNDDIRVPRFIETVPTAGYRFIAVVDETQPAAREQAHVAGLAESNSAPGTAGLARGRGLNRRRWALIGGGLVLLVLVAAIWFVRSRRVLTEKDTVVLAEFVNSTGDAVFDGTLRQGMEVQLEQSPFLSLVSDEQIQQVVGLMGRPANTRLTPEIAREVCERTASAAVLEGSIASLGSEYVLGLRARDCRTQKVLAVQQVQAARKEDVLRVLSQIASRFRTELGESLATVQQHNKPLADATTPSLEALKAYSTALQVNLLTGSDAAIPLLQRAVEIDPQFAMAYAHLAHAYGELNESDRAGEFALKAFQLQDRASDRERFYVATAYHHRVTQDLEKLQQISQLWAHTYPRDPEPHDYMALIAALGGRWEKSVEESNQSIEADPNYPLGYFGLSASQLALGHIQLSEQALQAELNHKLSLPDLFIQQYDLEFVKGDKAAMERAAIAGHGSPGSDDIMFMHEAFASAYRGHQREAERMTRRAEELAVQGSQTERAALYKTGAAVRQGLFGNRAGAKQEATEALALSQDREVEYGAALALALAGDRSRSENVANDLEARFRDDTMGRVNSLPSLRGLLAVERGEPAKAIEILEVATPYEMGQPRAFIHGCFGALYPVYIRGQAYLAAHQGVQAVAEFQKIIDHPGIVISDPIGALARLQIGRAYAMAGNSSKAKAAYADFLNLWKNADPDIPVLMEAKREYAALQ